MIAKKITLAHFETKNNSIINLPKTSPYWPEVEYHILTVDDAGNIYLLNLWNNEILVYDGNGKFQKSIRLKVKLHRFKYGNGKLEVSGDGKRLFVTGYDQNEKIIQFIFDKDGNVIKNLSKKDEIVWNFPNLRSCDKTYIYRKGRLVYDDNLHLIGDKFLFSDSQGQYSIKGKILIKKTKDGVKIWEKQFDGNFGIIGIDQNNYVYIEGSLTKGDPNSVYKLNESGEILAQASIPEPFPLLTKEETDEWEGHTSDDYYSFFKLACNGDLYLIYQLTELPELTLNRWLKGGEYFIYKFESAK
jgi:hypothetical protein